MPVMLLHFTCLLSEEGVQNTIIVTVKYPGAHKGISFHKEVFVSTWIFVLLKFQMSP